MSTDLPKRSMRAEIARLSLSVPIYQDEKTTKRLIQQVNERFEEFEGKSSKIDSLAFALQAALSFAADLHEAQEDQAEETKEVLVALDALAETLQTALEEPPEKPDEK